MLHEPPPSPGDLRFRLLGIPVRVHPMFWVISVLMGLNSGSPTPPRELVAWIAVVFVSILVHELGHAVLQRRFGGRPWITLHGFGGLASCSDCDQRTSSQIAISLAGPVAGFLLAILSVVAIRASGHPIYWTRSSGVPVTMGVTDPAGLGLFGIVIYWQEFQSDAANLVLINLLWVNIAWGLINLLPVYPLDGGRIMRELCTMRNVRWGVKLSLQISLVTAALMAAYALTQWKSLWTAILFGYFAYANVQTLRANFGSIR